MKSLQQALVALGHALQSLVWHVSSELYFVGARVGAFVGASVGASVGAFVGALVGALVGYCVCPTAVSQPFCNTQVAQCPLVLAIRSLQHAIRAAGHVLHLPLDWWHVSSSAYLVGAADGVTLGALVGALVGVFVGASVGA